MLTSDHWTVTTINDTNQIKWHYEKPCLICDREHIVDRDLRHNIIVCEGACREVLELNPLEYDKYLPLILYVYCPQPEPIQLHTDKYTYTTNAIHLKPIPVTFRTISSSWT